MGGNLFAAANFLVNTLFGLYIGAVMLRFMLGLRRADFRNPLAQFLVKATNPALLPLRRVIPPVAGADAAAIVLMALLAIANVLIDLWLAPVMQPTLPGVALWALLRLAVVLVNVWFITVLLEALLSWTSAGGWHPMALALREINAPVLRPFRAVIKPVGGFDLSPLFALIALQVVSLLIPLHPWFR
jgi:YggT family protein